MRALCALFTVFLLAVVSVKTSQAHLQFNNNVAHNQKFLRGRKSTATFTRILKYVDVNDENAETDERGGDLPISIVSRVKTTFGSTTTRMKKWLSENQSPLLVFEKLQVKKAGFDLEKNPKLLNWFNYVQQFRTKSGEDFPDEKMYEFVAKSTSEAERLALIRSLKKFPELEDLSNGIQKGMFTKWVESNAHPPVVFDKLGAQMVNGKLAGTPAVKEWMSYTKMYRATWETQFRDEDIVTFLLTKTTSDTDIINVVLGFKNEQLEKALFAKWISRHYTPERVKNIVSSSTAPPGEQDRLIQHFQAMVNTVDHLTRRQWAEVIPRLKHSNSQT